MGREIEQVNVNGIEMRYSCFGEGPKTMVIIPGLSLIPVMTFAGFIAEAYKAFNDEFTVYVFERRENMPESYTVWDMARDTAEVMKYLGLSDICLFGTSQGGMIAQCISIEYPELVKKMVLGSTVSKILEVSEEGALGRWLRLAEEGKLHELNMDFSETVYSEETFEKSKEGIIALEGLVTPRDLKRFIILSRGTDGFDLTGELSRIKCPTLLIGSKKDKVFSVERMKETVEGINCESFFYEDYSHVVYDEAPDYKERLLKFFRD